MVSVHFPEAGLRIRPSGHACAVRRVSPQWRVSTPAFTFVNRFFSETRLFLIYLKSESIFPRFRAIPPLRPGHQEFMSNGDTCVISAIEPRRLLAEIARLQAASARVLARRLSMPLEAVSGALARLEVAGLIHASYLDGADDQYSLSPAGHAWLEREEASAPRQRA